MPVAKTFVEEHHGGALHLVGGQNIVNNYLETYLKILTLTKARRDAAMTQMEEARKRAVAVRGDARTAFVKILKMTESQLYLMIRSRLT